MTDDRKQELERLEKELLADIQEEDDLLSDISMAVLEATSTESKELPITTEEDDVDDLEEFRALLKEEEPAPEEQPVTPSKVTKKKDDRVVIILMALASFLCLGIIGVMMYWLEIFLK